MKSPEQEARSTLDALQTRLLAAQVRGDEAALRRINLALAEPLAQLAESRAHAFDFTAADTYLQDLERLVHHLARDDADPPANPGTDERVRAEAALGEARGLFAVFGQMDFSDGDGDLERAANRYQETAETEIREGRRAGAAGIARGLVLRTRGVQHYALGRAAIEAADGAAAEQFFAAAAEAFTDAALVLRPATSVDAPDTACPAHPGYADCLAALADAFGHRATADSRAFQANPEAAAECLQAHIQGLRQARHHLLGLHAELADLLGRRIDLDIGLAERRRAQFEGMPKSRGKSGGLPAFLRRGF